MLESVGGGFWLFMRRMEIVRQGLNRKGVFPLAADLSGWLLLYYTWPHTHTLIPVAEFSARILFAIRAAAFFPIQRICSFLLPLETVPLTAL
jgi:hypothetical protein